MEKINCNHNCGVCLACAHTADEIQPRFTTYHFNGLTVSTGNNKIGATVNYSLDNRYCNPSWACYKYCYAKKYCEFRPSCLTAYNRNTDLLENNPAAFWDGVEKAFQLAVLLNAGLRVHVDGEIPKGKAGVKYVEHLQQYARKYPGVVVILMTKNYTAVNEWIKNHGGNKSACAPNCIPAFSVCPGLEMDNPYSLPIADFIPRGTQAPDPSAVCPNQTAKKAGLKWTCADCVKKGIKCAAGQDRAFMEHN